MFQRIVDMLLSLQLRYLGSTPYKQQMKPIKVFLKSQIKLLKQYLYPVSTRAVLKELWMKIVQVSFLSLIKIFKFFIHSLCVAGDMFYESDISVSSLQSDLNS